MKTKTLKRFQFTLQFGQLSGFMKNYINKVKQYLGQIDLLTISTTINDTFMSQSVIRKKKLKHKTIKI